MDAEQLVTEVAKELAPVIYQDLAQKSVRTIGDTAERSVKLVLSPLNGLLWGGEKIVNWIAQTIEPEFEKIPFDKRQPPAPEIAVPLIQAMYYSANNEELRTMYAKLLLTSMNADISYDAHPSFVAIIQQMDSLDALLFKKLSHSKPTKAINPSFIRNGATYTSTCIPDWYTGISIPKYNMHYISASLIRLSKFGLIDLRRDIPADNSDYNELYTSPELLECIKGFYEPDESVQVTGTKSSIYVNDYGHQFGGACVYEKVYPKQKTA